MPVVFTDQFAFTSALLGGISLIPAGIATLLTARQYRQERHLTSFIIFAWVTSSLVWNLVLTMSQAIFLVPVPNPDLVSTNIFLASVGLVVPIASLAIFAADFLTQEGINPSHLFVTTILGTGMVILIFVPGQCYVQGGLVSATELELAFVPTVLLAFNVVLGIYYSLLFAKLAIKILKSAPPVLKRVARLFLVGGFIATLGVTIVTFLGLGMLVPGSTQFTAALGTLIIAIALAKEPKIFYLLPSQVIRVTVLETKGGIALFSHTWKGQEGVVDEALFSGMLQGVGLIIRESLNRGDVREIVVDKATLIINRPQNYPIAFVLVVTNPTKTFRLALQTFASRFIAQFEKNFVDLSNVGQFEPAITLVNECFPYVPQ